MTLDEVSVVWKGSAPRDDSYDSRCNDRRMDIVPHLQRLLRQGLTESQVRHALGNPDEDPHPDETYPRPHLNYSMGLCGFEYESFLVLFRNGRSVEGLLVRS